MSELAAMVELISGTPQFRIRDALNEEAPTFCFYGQSEIENDLTGLELQAGIKKQIRTFDNVCTTKTGDVIFSLISGKATIVQKIHSEYLLTQNYVKLVPSSVIGAKYLVFLINEDAGIKRQLQSGQQGSATLKYTIRQLGNLDIPKLPTAEMQQVVGELYFNQLRITALKNRVAAMETSYILRKIKEATRHE